MLRIWGPKGVTVIWVPELRNKPRIQILAKNKKMDQMLQTLPIISSLTNDFILVRSLFSFKSPKSKVSNSNSKEMSKILCFLNSMRACGLWNWHPHKKGISFLLVLNWTLPLQCSLRASLIVWNSWHYLWAIL